MLPDRSTDQYQLLFAQAIELSDLKVVLAAVSLRMMERPKGLLTPSARFRFPIHEHGHRKPDQYEENEYPSKNPNVTRDRSEKEDDYVAHQSLNRS